MNPSAAPPVAPAAPTEDTPLVGAPVAGAAADANAGAAPAPAPVAGQPSFEAFQRMALNAQPGEFPEFDKLRAQNNAADAAATGVDDSQLRGDAWDRMHPSHQSGPVMDFLLQHRGEENVIGRLGHAIARGGLEAYNAANRAVTIGALHVGQGLGLIGLTPGERAALAHYFDPHVPADQKRFATTVDPSTIDRVAGPAQGGLYGILQGLTEFGTEFALTGELAAGAGAVVKGAAGLAGEAEAAAKGLGYVAKLNTAGVSQAAATQVLFEDPYRSRVSNLLAEAPPQFSSPWVSWLNAPIKALGPYADALKADPLDGKGLATAKNVTEGLILGMPMAFAGHVLGARLLKTERALSEKAINEAQAKALIEAAHRDYADAIAEGAQQVTDPAAPSRVVDLPNGQKQIELTGEGGRTVPGPTFDTDLEAQAGKAAVDQHFAAVRAAREPLPADAVAQLQAKVKALGEHPEVDAMENLLRDYGINGKYLAAPNDAVKMLKQVVDLRPEDMEALRSKPTGWADTVADAQRLFPDGSLSARTLKPLLERLGVHLDRAPAILTAARAFINIQAQEVRKLSTLVEMYPGNGALENHLLDAVNALHGVHSEFVGANASVGRSLNINKMDPGALAEKFRPGAVPEAATAPEPGIADGSAAAAPKALSRDEAIDLAHLIATADPKDVEGTLKLISGPTKREINAAPPSKKARLLNWAIGLRTEGMLSSPKTQVVNLLSNSMRLVTNPMETALAGVGDVIRGDGPETLKQAGDLAVGQLMAFRDAVKFMRKSFAENRPILDSGNYVPEVPNVAAPSNFVEGILDGPWSAVKTLARLPSRGMTAGDELFSQILYRSKVRQQILADLRAKIEAGTINTKQDLEALAERRISAAIDDGGRGIYKPALDYARDGTYKTDLTGFPKVFQQLINSHPVTRFLFPFVRTPVNVFDYTWQLTPGLNVFNKRMQAALDAGGLEAKEAVARAQIGAGIYSLAAFLAATGKITGNGPSDPKIRETWSMFNQPNSWRHDDGSFTSFKRGDTLMTPLSIMADVFTASGNMTDNDRYSMAAALTAAFAKASLNHSYLSNLDNLLDLGSGNPADVDRFFGQLAGSFVPAIANDAARYIDPDTHELITLWDSVRERVPGYSKTLEPKMNLLGERVMGPVGFGGVLNPFTQWSPEGDPYVNSELSKLGRNLAPLPRKLEHSNIDLTDRTAFGADQDGKSPYLRWHELMANPFGEGNPSLREKLTEVIKSDEWKSLTGDDAYSDGGQKYKIVARIVHAYQVAAKQKLLEEYPTLRQALQDEMQISAAGVIGGRPAAEIKANELRGLTGLIHRVHQ